MPTRLKPTRLEYVVDGVKLRSQLSTAALEHLGDLAAQRKAALEILKAALFRGRMIAKERLENGAGGIETARLLSGVTDEVVSALYDFTTVHVFRARNPTEGERLALMAVGGYGRGTLAPYSDLDLLFVRPYKQTAHTESVIEFMLYALWDLGFKVGHASRTIEECIKLSREDYTIRTSILEARRLTGDGKLAEELVRRFRAEVVKGTGAEFVAAKLKERDERHARAGASRYMVEPNVKEGKGGLRDLNTLFWIAQYLHPGETLERVMQLEMFDRREVRGFIVAFDFLWAVRCHLHFATGRPEERLSFDLQPELARRMGYGDRGDAPAVERFMRRYFLIAKDVGALTRVFAAKLEADQVKMAPKGISRFIPGRKVTRKPLAEPGFHEVGGRLDVDPDIFEQDPVNLLRLFRIADQRNLDLHPDAFTAASRSTNLITSAVRRDRHAAKVFLDILARGRDPRTTLTLMNEAGVLGRYLPEFGRIVAQMQFNMYHSYTVDEHTLRAVGVIAEIAAGSLAEDHPLSNQVMPLIVDREALFLAMLLHDTGKGGAGGQEVAGARAARQACERLGLERSKIELVAWLVEHHLVMSDYAQKRDVSDPRTVGDFARIVQTPERLRLLLVLTVADIRAVGPGVWNGWKGQLMRELYAATEAVFRGGRGSDATAALKRYQENAAYDARVRLAKADPKAEAWGDAMEDAYFTAFEDAEVLTHARLSQTAREGLGAAAICAVRPDLNASELMVAAADRPRLFMDVADAITAAGANVVGARVFTSRTGQALDVFYVQDVGGQPFGVADERVLIRLADDLAAAARGEPPAREVRRKDMGRAAAFAITPNVMLDNEASETATVVETAGRDRPGLLAALARTLAEAGLTITSAHIDGYGERAVDAFYVVDATGAKVTDAKKRNALKAALLAALSDEAEPANARRAALPKARASVAR
ncbi:[protein-PII] uridylyltransferase [Phenylobacterium sp.]|uniref:[protein-PII] uridylyltransferase n=1 Tax=Phenylobacterium sp. TaxID=1871053 RepID=UPI0025F7EFE0|nr:[protein-PII] uridylyltransferase [Phenylobacterium sp.]MBX3482672.1 [protein-PII] uridylyltransferase [Phenylobacterium sp.]MCW5759879.1 [protein-PII] uridylyltransferase [Phenylobacterium sp.]